MSWREAVAVSVLSIGIIVALILIGKLVQMALLEITKSAALTGFMLMMLVFLCCGLIWACGVLFVK